MPRTVQLRRYNVKPHLLDEFLAWWPTRLVPARAPFGFTVESAYLNRETAEFTWAVSAEGDADEFRRLEQAWMDVARADGRVRGDRRLERLDGHRAGGAAASRTPPPRSRRTPASAAVTSTRRW